MVARRRERAGVVVGKVIEGWCGMGNGGERLEEDQNGISFWIKIFVNF